MLRMSRRFLSDGRRRKEARRGDVIGSFPFVDHPTLFPNLAFDDGIHIRNIASVVM